ncbi:MAG: putative ABC transporter permease [Eubacteriaceae bacterium]
MRKNGNKSFASGIDYYKLFWVFLIGCFLGVVVETLFCLVTNGYIESRQGVIYGPFNPVYGFGAVLLTLVLHPVAKKNWFIIFLFSMVLGGGFEFISSYIQQMTTGTISWQYHDLPFNLAGRTSLMYSFFWGILGLLWVKEIYPIMSKFIEKIPKKMGVPLTWVLTVLMVFNMGISLVAINRWNERLAGVPASTAFERFLDDAYPDDYLKKIYPNMIHVGKK